MFLSFKFSVRNGINYNNIHHQPCIPLAALRSFFLASSSLMFCSLQTAVSFFSLASSSAICLGNSTLMVSTVFFPESFAASISC